MADLLGYLLELDDANDRAATERAVSGDPKLQAELARWQQSLEPLQLVGEDSELPSGLADRTLARLFTSGGVTYPAPSRDAVSTASGWTTRARWDVAISLVLLVAVSGFGMAALSRWTHSRAVQSCRGNLQNMWQGLEMFASTHTNKYPDLSEHGDQRKAGTFLRVLNDSGCIPPATTASCPGVQLPASGRPLEIEELDYAYHLGFRSIEGRLSHLQRGAENTDDQCAILADLPLADWTPRNSRGNHRGGANVLFLGGNVRFCTIPLVGYDRENIYLNDAGKIAAGLHPRDTVLGEKDDHP